jgi:hypothetical protein
MSDWVQNTGGVTLTADNQKITPPPTPQSCFNAILSTANFMWSGLGWNRGLHYDKSAYNRLHHSMDTKHEREYLMQNDVA